MITKYAKFAKRLPSWLYKIGAQAYIDLEFPRHLFIETTATCNLTCGYCPREKIRKDMDFELFRKIIDEATGYGPRSFSLHLFGEPLLYPRIFEAIAYIKKRNPSHTILLTTNGTLLNKCINELVQTDVDLCLWTWRTEAKFTEETLRRLRQWGRFRVRFIKEITPKEAYKEWEDWPNKEERRMHNYGGEIELEKFNKVQTPLKESSRWPCYHLWLAPAIAWNGKFLMCCADPHQKEVFGDINNETVSQAWKRLAKVRESHLKGEYKGICAGCDTWREYPNLFFSWQRTT